MVDIVVQPGDVLRVVVASERWLYPGCLCMLSGSPVSDLQVSRGFGLLGDEEHFVPSPGSQSTGDTTSIS